LYSRQKVRHVDFSPDGRRLATAGDEGTAKVWDFDPELAEVKNAPLHSLTEHHVLNVAFSPDGKRLASAGRDDKTVRVWDVATGRAGITYIALDLGAPRTAADFAVAAPASVSAGHPL
jgi:WD40 repeat protein